VVGWPERVARAVENAGTPCYLTAWNLVEQAAATLDCVPAVIPVRSWLSYKTHPLPALAERWLRAGRGVEVVSEYEFAAVVALGATVDQMLINGVAKHAWLARHPLRGLRVHLESTHELESLLPLAVERQWRVGIRLQAPDECDARDPRFRGQFGFSRDEALRALASLRHAGANVEGVHFHLGQRRPQRGAYRRAVEFVGGVCDEAGLAPSYLDCGGGLPGGHDPTCAAALDDLADAFESAPVLLPTLDEIWIENGRFVTEASTALAVKVLDVKERDECRYLICDGGRTNHALAADTHAHDLLVVPPRDGPERLTTICGPTCMTDDCLGRRSLPASIGVGDVIAWLDAGAYHLPWETRFSHGLCAVVWFDDDEEPTVARAREAAPTWVC
jgi:diaminopimelate decarboxylase